MKDTTNTTDKVEDDNDENSLNGGLQGTSKVTSVCQDSACLTAATTANPSQLSELKDHRSESQRRRMNSSEESLAVIGQEKKEIPLLFERAGKQWWKPEFDSPLLETQYLASLRPRNTRRFQLGLIYILLLSFVMAIYYYVVLKHWVLPFIVSLGNS